MKYCPNCGEKITEGRFCSNCGFELTSDYEEMSEGNFNEMRRQGSLDSGLLEEPFEKFADIFLEIIGWILGTIGALSIFGDLSVAIAFVIAHILYSIHGHLRFKVLMIIAAVLFILLTLVGFINGFMNGYINSGIYY